MLDGGYARGAQLLCKLSINQLLALDIHGCLFIYRLLSGRSPAQATHSDDESDEFDVGTGVLASR